MAGYIKIMRSDLATGTGGRPAEEYRFSYVTGSNAWVGTFDFNGLQNFLISEIGLTPSRTTEVVNQARLQGTVTLPEISLSENRAAQMGLAQLPSDG
jgi:hypothetical protein